MECIGVDSVMFAAMKRVRADGVVCPTGASSGAHVMSSVNLGALNRDLVRENNTVAGSVDANRRHDELGADSLTRANRGWLRRLITRRVPLARWPAGPLARWPAGPLARWEEAFEPRSGDVKTVIVVSSWRPASVPASASSSTVHFAAAIPGVCAAAR